MVFLLAVVCGFIVLPMGYACPGQQQMLAAPATGGGRSSGIAVQSNPEFVESNSHNEAS